MNKKYLKYLAILTIIIALLSFMATRDRKWGLFSNEPRNSNTSPSQNHTSSIRNQSNLDHGLQPQIVNGNHLVDELTKLGNRDKLKLFWELSNSDPDKYIVLDDLFSTLMSGQDLAKLISSLDAAEQTIWNQKLAARFCDENNFNEFFTIFKTLPLGISRQVLLYEAASTFKPGELLSLVDEVTTANDQDEIDAMTEALMQINVDGDNSKELNLAELQKLVDYANLCKIEKLSNALKYKVGYISSLSSPAPSEISSDPKVRQGQIDYYIQNEPQVAANIITKNINNATERKANIIELAQKTYVTETFNKSIEMGSNFSGTDQTTFYKELGHQFAFRDSMGLSKFILESNAEQKIKNIFAQQLSSYLMSKGDKSNAEKWLKYAFPK
jgi:hypothetical protein